MGKVVFNMTMSLDGYVAGPHDGPENGLGDGGSALFRWYFAGDTEISLGPGAPIMKLSAQSAAILQDAMSKLGAGVWGRKTFDIAQGWGGYPPGRPAFIVTHTIPQEWVKEGSPFVFVTDGVESAIQQAKQAAGEKDVALCTASVLQQALKAGLVDEIYVDVVPLLLGAGVRLFELAGIQPTDLDIIHSIQAPGVLHLGFRVLR